MNRDERTWFFIAAAFAAPLLLLLLAVVTHWLKRDRTNP